MARPADRGRGDPDSKRAGTEPFVGRLTDDLRFLQILPVFRRGVSNTVRPTDAPIRCRLPPGPLILHWAMASGVEIRASPVISTWRLRPLPFRHRAKARSTNHANDVCDREPSLIATVSGSGGSTAWPNGCPDLTINRSGSKRRGVGRLARAAAC